ncbi:hypothetical protein [Sphingobium sp. Ant17]|jgi:hypothetical protein|uniref:hypothetical protein n=1 Tax=Sphingobium sp. Ant17 TaxID=1461752 RepID=UPI00044863CD|nr:hypothetical protein [Sphingobium sp. Ant17]EXS68210.1 hypothetical protein BF95_16980 [Sphingobium sp. Ant17]OHD00008.1 MAG: hypothetical protein A2095_10375 [Sphingomonadales bacterium GWF1_63_6]|tara:strand:- start:5679 stop:5951 length:273 start_codon:yes stop_codon:yes gene_type:complete
MPQILTALYLIAMLAAGWRLFGLGWSRGVKIATAVALILPFPLLMLLPALIEPARPFADLLRAMGLTLLLCGALCLGGGWSAAKMRARRR